MLAEARVPSQQPWTCCGWFSNDIPRRHGSPRGDPRPPREGPDHASAATCGQPAHTCLSILVRQTGAQGTEAQNEPCLPVERKNESKNWSRQQPRRLPWKVTGRTHPHGSSTGVSPSGVSPEHSADPALSRPPSQAYKSEHEEEWNLKVLRAKQLRGGRRNLVPSL